jgi:hypothetical protein
VFYLADCCDRPHRNFRCELLLFKPLANRSHLFNFARQCPAWTEVSKGACFSRSLCLLRFSSLGFNTLTKVVEGKSNAAT